MIGYIISNDDDLGPIYNIKAIQNFKPLKNLFQEPLKNMYFINTFYEPKHVYPYYDDDEDFFWYDVKRYMAFSYSKWKIIFYWLHLNGIYLHKNNIKNILTEKFVQNNKNFVRTYRYKTKNKYLKGYKKN